MTSTVSVQEIYSIHELEDVNQKDMYRLWKRAVKDGHRIPARAALPREELSRHKAQLMISRLDRENKKILQLHIPESLAALQQQLCREHDLMIGRKTDVRHKEILMVADLFRKPLMLMHSVDDVAAGGKREVHSLLLPLGDNGQTPDMLLHHVRVSEEVTPAGKLCSELG